MADRQQNDFPASNVAGTEDLQLGGGDLDADLDGGEPDAAGLDQA